jgi:hypothetical protein
VQKYEIERTSTYTHREGQNKCSHTEENQGGNHLVFVFWLVRSSTISMFHAPFVRQEPVILTQLLRVEYMHAQLSVLLVVAAGDYYRLPSTSLEGLISGSRRICKKCVIIIIFIIIYIQRDRERDRERLQRESLEREKV